MTTCIIEKIMRRAGGMLVTTVAAACFIACGSAEYRRTVATADSLAEADPVVAVKFIDKSGYGDYGRSGRMKMLLLRTKALNKLGCPLDTDTLMSLVKYFDDHGRANDKMLANYILGCYYISKGNSPDAIRYLRIAAEAADTIDVGCDWRTLHKVHVHTAQQLMYQNALMDAMDENTLALKYAMAAKDTFNAIITLEQRSNIYLNQKQEDKAFDIRSKLYGMYMRHGYAKEAAISLGPLVKMHVERGNIIEAKRCLDIYEKKSGLIDSDGNIEKGREAYYLDKGFYLIKINKLDSAESYFRKCISLVDLSDVLRDCYTELSNLYKKRHYPDSIAKYSDLARITTDSMYAEMNTTHLQQMRAMYNYNEYKLSAEVYKRKVISARLTIIILIFAVAIVIIGVAIYIRRKRRIRRMEMLKYERSIAELERARQELYSINERQQTEMARMIDEKTKEIKRQKEANDTYLHDIRELERSRDELYDLSERQRAEFNRLIEEKDAQIDQLHTEKQKYEKVTTKVNNINKYSDEPIVKRLRRHVRKELVPMTEKEVNQLKHLFVNEKQFNVIENVVTKYEYQVCMLVRTGFTPSDICILTGTSKSNIANIRKRLYMKLTGRNGSSKDFDMYINSL